GKPTETFQSHAMLDGIEKEDESRRIYAMINEVEVEQVGIIYQNEERKILASPDGLINREYGLELKNVLPKTQVYYLLNSNKLLTEYFVQVQACLFISNFKRWDLFSYCEGLPPLILRVERDEKYISSLAEELEKFCYELQKMIKTLKNLQ
ncbi:MAG: YqaJ viral recombinase family protein, partial [Flavobacterium sp.]|nr:YqaJ viral recombinase family protein [Flavobacterium sp.]